MELTYRAQSFNYTAKPRHHSYPRAINWRHQVPGIDCTPIPSEVPNQAINPEAINWRYQLPNR
jgi:hypothetical protein